jgi:DNA-binding CsgD family transcriptional regulator
MPSRSHRLHALAGAIGAAAEAASLEELAATAFPKLGAALDACPGILFAIKPDRPTPVALALFGGQASTIFPWFMQSIASDDPLFHVSAYLVAPIHVPLHHADQKAFLATRAYTDFYRAHDIAHKLYVRFAGARLAAREAVEILADRAGRSGVLALDRAGRVLWMSPRARALLGHGPLAPSLVCAARRLAQTVLARAVKAAPLELRVHFNVHARVGVDAELSIARTPSGERIIAVGLEQTDPPRAQVAGAAMRFGLTVAEADVLAMMANGLSNAAIAGRFGIALPTVKTHVHRVIQKMGVTSRLQAVLLARKLN